jgi:hypothetical protein
MNILLVISILCFCALLLATAAITRDVRTCPAPARSQIDFAQLLFAAAKDQDSLTPHIRQQLTAKSAVARMSWDNGLKSIPCNLRSQSISSKRL